jgi:hypothetical protein
MPHWSDEARWRQLESEAHLPEVQDIIREEIQNGAIRVRPKPEGGICIVPIDTPDSAEVQEMEPPAAPTHDGTSPLRRAVRTRRVQRLMRP